MDWAEISQQKFHQYAKQRHIWNDPAIQMCVVAFNCVKSI